MKYNTASLTDADNNDGSDSKNEVGEEEAVPAAPKNEANVDPEAKRCPACLMNNPEEKWARHSTVVQHLVVEALTKISKKLSQ